MKILINGEPRAVASAWQGETLLACLRDHLGLMGTKFGCGVGLCGACTVLLDGTATRSCLIKVADLGTSAITTIEGIAAADRLHPLQQAWLDERVPQCGYCQSGQIMSALSLLRHCPLPSDAQIDAALAGNLCRCGTQQRIRLAVRRAAGQLGEP